MCLFTHVAAGGLAGALTQNPLLALVAGVASHAVLDMFPHYDHPDWRVELTGGLAALALLLLLPGGGWIAGLGGVGGMVPDLENLLEKLGKMKRSRFVFPSHTGLIPHGREIGPRHLIWQAILFVACFVALGLLRPGVAAAQALERPGSAGLADERVDLTVARPRIEVLESRAERTVVRVVVAAQGGGGPEISGTVVWWAPATTYQRDDGTEAALPHGVDLLVAVPTRDAVSVRLRNLRWHREPTGGADPEALVTVAGPTVVRKVPLAKLRLAVEQGDGVVATVDLIVEHRATGREAEYLRLGAERAEESGAQLPPSPAGLVNPTVQIALARGAAAAVRQTRARARQEPSHPFDLTDNWVRMEIDATGVYRLTGSDLSLHVLLDEVDPLKIRLFRGGGISLHPLPEYPDSLESERIGLNEVTIYLAAAEIDDGEFNLTDAMLFYGVGTSTWRDHFERSARRLDHYEHHYADRAVYWLTWEDHATDSPFPGDPRRILPAAAGPEPAIVVDRHLARLHREESYFGEMGRVADNWVWDNAVDFSKSMTFYADYPIPGEDALFVVDTRGLPANRRSRPSAYLYEAEAWINNDPNHAEAAFTHSQQAHRDSVRVRVVGTTNQLRQGTNTLTLLNQTQGQTFYDVFYAKSPLLLDSFDLLYWAELRKPASRPLEFGHWRDQVSGVADVRLQMALPPDNPTVFWWDVSRADSVVALPVVQSASPEPNAYVDLVRSDQEDRRFLVFARGDERTVPSLERAYPASLRRILPDADYVVIYNERFSQAANSLVGLRARLLPGVADPRAVAVTTREIYDNFSGGQKDLYALRDFLHWYYEKTFGGDHPLRYVCFLGDATRDYRNYLQRDPNSDLYDFVPTAIRTLFPQNPDALTSRAPYASDDELTSFEDPGTFLDDPDLASGRLPVRNAESALALVERIRSYCEDPPEGSWRNTVVFVADDLHQPSGGDNQFGEVPHTREAELLANEFVPLAVDMRKVFMVDYEFPPGNSSYKPEARNDLLRYLSQGTTIFYYVGHGAENILADEQVFRTQDVSSLTNGAKRYIFMAFSCDVGVYDDPDRQSMGETMILQETGGGIASIAASQVSFITHNEPLSEAFFDNLYPDQHIRADVALGESLWLSKQEIHPRSWANAQRYTLFGDPALNLPYPVDDLAFAAGTTDTLRAGYRQVLRLDAAAMGLPTGADVAYDVQVEESAEEYEYYPTITAWRLGATLFRGTGPVETDILTIPFKAPLQLQSGERGRVRLIVRTPDEERSAALRVPVVRGAPPPSDDFEGPAIDLAMEDNRFRVRPGTVLSGVVTDTSGVAMLGTSPGNSVLLEFDGTGFMTNVSESFVFDPGSYTSGRLDIPLPQDLELGTHTAALYANDVLGNVGTDTLSFIVVPEGISGIVGTTLFPNPTSGECWLVFELSDPMEVTWDIYTVAGRLIWSYSDNFGPGPQKIRWDGRDRVDDEIANGVYIYVLRGRGVGGGGRDIRQTGQLVIMH